jgi:hypothetical protein
LSASPSRASPATSSCWARRAGGALQGRQLGVLPRRRPGSGAELGAAIAALADPALQEADKARLAHVRQARANAAAAYFKSNAAEWERIRSLHAPERDVEDAIARHLTSTGIENFLDAGTGTGGCWN